MRKNQPEVSKKVVSICGFLLYYMFNVTMLLSLMLGLLQSYKCLILMLS